MQVSFEKDGVARIGFNHMTGVQDLPEEQRVLPVGSAIGHYLAKDAWFRIVEVGYSVILFSEHAYVNRILNKKTSEANYSGLPPELQGEVLQRAGRKGKLTDLQRPVSEFAIFECTVQLLSPLTALSEETEDGWVALLATHAPGKIQRPPPNYRNPKAQILELQHLAFYAPLTEAPYKVDDVMEDSNLQYLTYVSLPRVGVLLDDSFGDCNRLAELALPAMHKITHFNYQLETLEKGDLNALVKPLQSCLRMINIDSIKEMPADTFAGFSLLEEVQCKSVEVIGSYAFSYCENLKILPSMDKLNVMGDGAFSYSGIQVFLCNGPIETVPQYAFLHCIHLTSISMSNIKTVIKEAFSGCKNLETAALPQAKTLGKNSFQDCLDVTVLTKFYADYSSKHRRGHIFGLDFRGKVKEFKCGEEDAEIDAMCSVMAPERIIVDSSDSALLAWQLV